MIAFAIAVPGDIRLLAGIYAFGATLAIAIAHLSVVRLRWTDPERDRPFRMPFDVTVRGRKLPVPAIAGAALMLLLWIAVLAFQENARWVGGGWMLFGLGAYVVYRRFVEQTSLTKRVSVPEEALRKEVREAEYGDILVPVFGTELDDDIVSTAGRLADAADRPGEQAPSLEVIYVMDLPLTVPLDAPPPKERLEAAQAALQRAREVGEEYETVEVETDLVPARSVGAGIVDEARRRNVEVIVMGGEPPSRMRGGAILGGIRRVTPAGGGRGDGVRAEEGALQGAADRSALGLGPTGRRAAQSAQKSCTISESPAWWGPKTSSSRPSGPASNARVTRGAIRIASMGPISITSSSSFTRPPPESTTLISSASSWRWANAWRLPGRTTW